MTEKIVFLHKESEDDIQLTYEGHAGTLSIKKSGPLYNEEPAEDQVIVIRIIDRISHDEYNDRAQQAYDDEQAEIGASMHTAQALPHPGADLPW